eukprot:c8816_g1_i1 orf=3-176(-)
MVGGKDDILRHCPCEYEYSYILQEAHIRKDNVMVDHKRIALCNKLLDSLIEDCKRTSF